MIIYSRLCPNTRGFVFTSSLKMTEKEENVFLETVPGKWKKFEPPEGLKGKPTKIKSVATQPSITIKQRDATGEALQKVVEALYLPSLQPCLLQPPKGIAHNGPRIFAFRVACGIAICSYDGANAIKTWAEQFISKKEAAKKKPEKNLNGF